MMMKKKKRDAFRVRISKQMSFSSAGWNWKMWFRRSSLQRKKAQDLGFDKYIISATSPFLPEDLAALRTNAAQVVGKYFPDYQKVYESYNWEMLADIDRVYVNEKGQGSIGLETKI
jgi:UDP-glucose 4-epimerase